jgi:hypothetical protein
MTGEHANAWTRGIGELLREAMAFGYGKFANTYIDWLDQCLFKEANPPHWNRKTGDPQFARQQRQVGEIVENGNRENDGHGICMWGRYMVYHWLGHPDAWNQKRWDATKAAVDWIQWQLDTDHLFPGIEKDVLFTESECAHDSYDFYSSFNCLHGIRLAIKMAQDLGKDQEIQDWTKLYAKLQKGILDQLVDESEFGPTWHTEPDCDWQDHAHKLAHVQLAPDGLTYTPLQDFAKSDALERKYLEIDLNSYRFLMKEKNYNCLRMYGYGQGMMTQAALLLDQMQDAEQFIHLMVTRCYLPHLEGWTAPEGIITHKSGKYWVPVNGYMGQDSHLADSMKGLRLMLGVDDNDPDHLRLVPRYPKSWTRMSISDFPVLTGKKRQYCAYHYTRNPKLQTFEFKFDKPVKMSVRLGPVQNVDSVKLDGKKIDSRLEYSGDSRWVWVEDIQGKTGIIDIIMK